MKTQGLISKKINSYSGRCREIERGKTSSKVRFIKKSESAKYVNELWDQQAKRQGYRSN